MYEEILNELLTICREARHDFELALVLMSPRDPRQPLMAQRCHGLDQAVAGLLQMIKGGPALMALEGLDEFIKATESDITLWASDRLHAERAIMMAVRAKLAAIEDVHSRHLERERFENGYVQISKMLH